MKASLCLLISLLSFSVFAQDPTAYLNSFDSKVYSLKAKGVKDFVVDIESSKLTKQMNDQQLFGKIDELIFRVFWTASPERLAIEIMGLPDGFKEVKEDLKASIIPLVENILPQNLTQKFAGYKLSQGKKPREILAQDTSGVAPIPSFSLIFDDKEKLSEVIGHKPVGTLEIQHTYEKESFSDGKWILKQLKTTTVDNGQTMIMTKELDYGKSQGMGVVSDVTVQTEFKSQNTKAKPIKVSEVISFKNYKINEGEALKYFLSESKK